MNTIRIHKVLRAKRLIESGEIDDPRIVNEAVRRAIENASQQIMHGDYCGCSSRSAVWSAVIVGASILIGLVLLLCNL